MTHTHTSPPAVVTVRPTDRDRSVLAAVLVVTAVSLTGSVYAVSSGLSPDWWDAVGPTGRLSVPLPMNLALLVAAGVVATAGRRTARVAAGLVALASVACVVSGFFDGGYDASLSAGQRVWQLALVGALAVMGAVAARSGWRR